MMLATVRMTIPRQKRGEALKILRSMAGQWRDEPGCLSCRIYKDLQEPNAVIIEEIWTSEEDLKRHVKSDGYQTLLLVMETASQPPEIAFSTVSPEEGMKTIERIRSDHTGLLVQI